MRLGNSGGNNTGKKYIKITGKEQSTPESQREYDLFCDWVAHHFNDIVSAQKRNQIYNPETINETYIKIGHKILYGGLIISDFASYFSRSYFTNYVLSQVKQPKATVSLDDDNLLCFDTPYDYSVDELIPFVSQYIRPKYPDIASKIFNDYFCVPDVKHTFRSLAKKYDVSLFHVHTTINCMIKDLQSNQFITENYTLAYD